MFVVTGATGNTGSVVAETLLQQGKQVKVVLRDNAKADGWKAKGAEAAIADMGDSAALAAALKGAEGAYILVPPLYGAPDFLAAMAKLSDSIAAAINTSGVPHIVMLSSVGAQHAEGIGPIRTCITRNQSSRRPHQMRRCCALPTSSRTMLPCSALLSAEACSPASSPPTSAFP